jgi:hypothetical protein
MRKKFNTTGVCIPEKHYMVDVSGKIAKIMEMIAAGEYFTITKPRQYGKTTILYLLTRELRKNEDYLVLNTSFEGMGAASYRSEPDFSAELLRQLKNIFTFLGQEKLLSLLNQRQCPQTLGELSDFITELVAVSRKMVVLIIDEVDQSSNNKLFLHFLGMLRNKYLRRVQGEDLTFQSVILAGVHDVKSLKSKIRPDAAQKYNSPWNIAADFEVDLGFTAAEIESMLREYSQEQETLMDTALLSAKLYYYTSGYPFLVSRLCKITDEKIVPGRAKPEWEIEDLEKASQILLKETNTNFESLIKNLENNQELAEIVNDIIMKGGERSFNPSNHLINLGVTYGIFKEQSGRLKIHNKIYEQIIYDYMASKAENSALASYNCSENFLVKGEGLDFEKVLLKFQEFIKKEYSGRDESFLEREGRLLFLAFIKPIINGKGYDFKEVEISEEKRLDVVVTYLAQKYVVELKIWKGPKAHEKGLSQLCDYLDRLSLDKGYLVIYDFTRAGQKEWKQDRVKVNEKEIFMVWV